MKNSRGGKRLIIPIFIPHQGCTHRCVFCNQEMITDRKAAIPSATQIEDSILSFLRTFDGRLQRREVAFYGGNFTALPFEDQRLLLRGAYPFIAENQIDAVRVSTRPDAIDAKGLDFLRDFAVETIEVGAQSMVDQVLRKCLRGHTSRDVLQSVRLAKSMGFEVGIQIMVGLPGEDMDLFLTTVRRVIDLAPDFVRVYPLLVLRGAPLERLYQSEAFVPIPLKEAVRRAKVALILFEQAHIPVIRMGLQATPTLEDSGTILAGPYHPAFRSLVESSIFYDMASRLLEDRANGNGHRVRFRVSPRDLSDLKGQRKENLARLRIAYGRGSIEVVPDPEIPRGKLLLEDSRGSLALSKKDLNWREVANGRDPWEITDKKEGEWGPENLD